jgi:nicotinamidase-related amidase
VLPQEGPISVRPSRLSNKSAIRRVAELLHMPWRDIIIGGGATNRGVETSIREAFSLDLASVVVRECCWSGDPAARAYSLDKAVKMYARIRHLDQVAAMPRD